jgi:hypothetical protein
VSHICAFLGHAYEIRWDQPLETLADLLDVIPRLHRSMGVALDLCTQLSDTLKGSPPVVPPYLSANKSLSELVRFLDGVPSAKMVGKQAIYINRAFIGIIRCRFDLITSVRPYHLAHCSVLCCKSHCSHCQL